jgi:hypothetical protein
MAYKRYTSYEEIDCELEILKVEKELNFQKIILNVESIKENFRPKNLIKGFLGSYSSILQNSYGKILSFAIPIVINWLKNRKRGK